MLMMLLLSVVLQFFAIAAAYATVGASYWWELRQAGSARGRRGEPESAVPGYPGGMTV